jgi:hypothetical protein
MTRDFFDGVTSAPNHDSINKSLQTTVSKTPMLFKKLALLILYSTILGKGSEMELVCAA